MTDFYRHNRGRCAGGIIARSTRKAGELPFRRLNGEPFPDVPQPPEVPTDPVAAVRARNEADGLALHARTALPLWLGERLNVGYAIDVLHPLATGER